jgi:hypothetical protein
MSNELIAVETGLAMEKNVAAQTVMRRKENLVIE